MNTERVFGNIIKKLRLAGLRATRQRIALAKIIFGKGNHHFTADSLFREATQKNVRLSMPTIYNTLRQFTDSNLLREIVVDSQRRYFDTNLTDHYHFYFTETCELEDIDANEIEISKVPSLAPSFKVERIDMIVRVTKK